MISKDVKVELLDLLMIWQYSLHTMKIIEEEN